MTEADCDLVIDKSYYDELLAKYNFMVDSAQQNAKERDEALQALTHMTKQWEESLKDIAKLDVKGLLGAQVCNELINRAKALLAKDKK